MDKTELTILGSGAGVALTVAAGVLLWIFVIGGAADEENPDDPLIEMRLEEMQPLCVDIILAVLTPDEITRTVGVADGKPFFHESAMTEETLGMPYAEISAECTRAVVRGFDASDGYYGHVSDCTRDLWEGGDAEAKPPIERLRQVIACADDAAGIGASADDGGDEPPDQPKG